MNPMLSFVRAIATANVFVAVALTQAPALSHGPLRGHADSSSLHVWARADGPGEFELTLLPIDAGTNTPPPVKATASDDHDCVLHWAVPALPAATSYRLRIRCGDVVVHEGTAPWSTGLPDDATTTTLAFGSCAHDKAFPEQPIWSRLLARSPQGLVLLGDTPYIDNASASARRARHRDFFAFPPVRTMLQAVPTWTTWDDHDFATNDVFGDAPGSKHSRGVFVDYHAHASFGDGTRGVWTNFRSGPVEVFLLDTRTCADDGPSPLAANERTLLGAAQLQWLQRGLLQSTATWKVLACGMVWNEGVRSGKKDCWGNWRGERDALFGWLGAQRIGGVVLVGGDVHRSRVILHPTTAACGYELPELVTSPLAQNVIDSNAAPVAGLVFDAGEPQSALLLTAVGRGDDALLRAVFVAGDGREFHTRTFRAAAMRRPDAADGYRQLGVTLRALLGPSLSLPPSDYADADFGVGDSEVLRPDWLAAVKAARPALATFASLADEPRCRFRGGDAETPAPEFRRELHDGLATLQTLAIADGLQRMAERDVDGLAAAVRSLLAMARHLQQEPGSLAWSLAARGERAAATLQRRAAKALGADAGQRLRELVRAHLTSRATLAAGVVALRQESFLVADEALRQWAMGGDLRSVVVRQSAAAVRSAFVTAANDLFALLDGIGTRATPAMREGLRAWTRDAQERFAGQPATSASLAQPGAKVPAGAVEAIAAQLALAACPELLRFVEDQADVLLLLADVAR
jgi:alkaline phosphatase D